MQFSFSFFLNNNWQRSSLHSQFQDDNITIENDVELKMDVIAIKKQISISIITKEQNISEQKMVMVKSLRREGRLCN